MHPFKQQFETLIRRSMSDLNLNWPIAGIAAVYEDPRYLCATLEGPNGRKCVFMDFRVCSDEVAALSDIKTQLQR